MGRLNATQPLNKKMTIQDQMVKPISFLLKIGKEPLELMGTLAHGEAKHFPCKENTTNDIEVTRNGDFIDMCLNISGNTIENYTCCILQDLTVQYFQRDSTWPSDRDISETEIENKQEIQTSNNQENKSTKGLDIPAENTRSNFENDSFVKDSTFETKSNPAERIDVAISDQEDTSEDARDIISVDTTNTLAENADESIGIDSTWLQDDTCYACPLCGQSYVTKHNLRIHVVEKHADRENQQQILFAIENATQTTGKSKKQRKSKRTPYTCSECQQAFQSLKAVKKHITSHHSGLKDCLENTLKNRTNEAEAKRLARKRKTYVSCDVCGISYLNCASGITRHMAIVHPTFVVKRRTRSDAKRAKNESDSEATCTVESKDEPVAEIESAEFRHFKNPAEKTNYVTSVCDKVNLQKDNNDTKLISIEEIVDQSTSYSSFDDISVNEEFISNLDTTKLEYTDNANSEALKEHQTAGIDTLNKTFLMKCGFCDEEYPSAKIISHLKDQHKALPDLQIYINQCLKYKQKLRDSLIDKEALKTEAILKECPFCRKTFKSRNLVPHMRQCRDNPDRITFKYCGCGFRSHILECMTKHKEECPLKNTAFVCELCGKKFNKKSTLYYHRRAAHGQCGKNFTMKYYECDQCDLKFTAPSRLKRHANTHNADAAKFMCELCGVSFTRKDVLYTHVRSQHERKFRHMCQQCDYGTNKRSQFERHKCDQSKPELNSTSSKNISPKVTKKRKPKNLKKSSAESIDPANSVIIQPAIAQHSGESEHDSASTLNIPKTLLLKERIGHQIIPAEGNKSIGRSQFMGTNITLVKETTEIESLGYKTTQDINMPSQEYITLPATQLQLLPQQLQFMTSSTNGYTNSAQMGTGITPLHATHMSQLALQQVVSQVVSQAVSQVTSHQDNHGLHQRLIAIPPINADNKSPEISTNQTIQQVALEQSTGIKLIGSETQPIISSQNQPIRDSENRPRSINAINATFKSENNSEIEKVSYLHERNIAISSAPDNNINTQLKPRLTGNNISLPQQQLTVIDADSLRSLQEMHAININPRDMRSQGLLLPQAANNSSIVSLQPVYSQNNGLVSTMTTDLTDFNIVIEANPDRTHSNSS